MHFKQNNNKVKFYLQGLRSFKNSLPKNVKKILNQKGYIYSEIVGRWTVIVGKSISEISFPKSIHTKNGNKLGLLTLLVERGKEVEIEYKKIQIIDKMNSFFGYKLISEIKTETFTSPASIKKELNKNYINKYSKKFEEKISTIKNKNIKDSLHKLISVIKK